MDAKPTFNGFVMTLFLEFLSICEEIPFILQRNSQSVLMPSQDDIIKKIWDKKDSEYSSNSTTKTFLTWKIMALLNLNFSHL